ncbi:MAG TPA: hydroxymethylglutaryl-CoA lyase [Hyphomicrobiaceae bacterium]|nr:hydroxymethylglutaryl-CoA lyase [Hyphomicrobiaceae bacterium]
MAKVEIVEVAPRDGFQSVRTIIPSEEKIAVIEQLAACGLPRIEVGSFVSPKALPQMSDTPQIMQRAHLPAGTRAMVLVPNARGLALAVEAGMPELNWVFSVTESHNRNNVRRSVEESVRDFTTAWQGLSGARPKLRLSLSTSFDCPWEGRVPEEAVVRCVERIIAAAPEVEIAICDTTGRAATNHVGALLALLLTRYASESVRFAFHGHDTYGLGVANALEAYRQGVRIIDGSAGGLGGCPFAPGAAGNTATEDLVFAFEHMGVATGVDLGRLLDAADRIAAIAPEQSGGKLRQVPRRRALSGFGAASRGVPAGATCG